MKTKNLIIKTLAVMMIFSGVVYAYSKETQKQVDNSQVIIEENSSVSPDMEDYIAHARKSIKSNWYPPVSSFENKATLVVTIDKNGQLTNCYIAESSSDKAFDESLIEAAKKSVYKPIPEQYSAKSASIALTFAMQRRHISKN